MPFDPNDYRNREGGRTAPNLFPLGKFIAQVTDHELGETSGGFKQMIVTFGDDKGRSRKAWLIYEGAAGFQFDGLLQACDWNEPLDLEDVQAVRDAIYDKDVEIVVKNERYAGNDTLKIKWINKAPGGTGQPSRTPADRHASGPPPRDAHQPGGAPRREAAPVGDDDLF